MFGPFHSKHPSNLREGQGIALRTLRSLRLNSMFGLTRPGWSLAQNAGEVRPSGVGPSPHDPPGNPLRAFVLTPPRIRSILSQLRGIPRRHPVRRIPWPAGRFRGRAAILRTHRLSSCPLSIRVASPHHSRAQLANDAGLTETPVLGGPGRTRCRWSLSTLRECASAPMLHPATGGIGPWSCKPGLFAALW